MRGSEHQTRFFRVLKATIVAAGRSPRSASSTYPTDVSDDEWAFVAPYVTLLDPAAPPRNHALGEVFNALRWIVRAGAPWRLRATPATRRPPRPPPWASAWRSSSSPRPSTASSSCPSARSWNAPSPGRRVTAASPATTSACPRPSPASTSSLSPACCSTALCSPFRKFITRASAVAEGVVWHVGYYMACKHLFLCVL
jgi:hypothetical protein